MDLSPGKLLVLAVVALIVLGPEKLPGAIRSVGKFWGEFQSFRASMESEVRNAVGDLPVGGLSGGITNAFRNPVSRLLDGVAATTSPGHPQRTQSATPSVPVPSGTRAPVRPSTPTPAGAAGPPGGARRGRLVPAPGDEMGSGDPLLN